MARSLSRTLNRTITSSSLSLSSLASANSLTPHRLLNFRCRSSLPEKSSNRPEFTLESDPEVERVVIQKLEDAIHRVIAKRVQPDWLLFLPGSSYWVPPSTREKGFVEVIRKLVTSSVSKDEAMALTTNRGWPSSDYFFKGVSSSSSTGEVEPSSKRTTQSEDEEG